MKSEFNDTKYLLISFLSKALKDWITNNLFQVLHIHFFVLQNSKIRMNKATAIPEVIATYNDKTFT